MGDILRIPADVPLSLRVVLLTIWLILILSLVVLVAWLVRDFKYYRLWVSLPNYRTDFEEFRRKFDSVESGFESYLYRTYYWRAVWAFVICMDLAALYFCYSNPYTPVGVPVDPDPSPYVDGVALMPDLVDFPLAIITFPFLSLALVSILWLWNIRKIYGPHRSYSHEKWGWPF